MAKQRKREVTPNTSLPPSPSHSLKHLSEHLYSLKILPRTGWLMRGIPNAESVASHSHGVSIWCLWLAARYEAHGKKVQREKLLTMAALHDLPEASIGDLMPTQKALLFGANPQEQKQAVREAEERYWEDLASWGNNAGFMGVFSSWHKNWVEYRKNSSLEAHIVKQADALDCVMQAIVYREHFRISLDDFIRLIPKAAGDDIELAEWLQELWDSSQ